MLLRHGESWANAAGRFTGRWDVALTVAGERQAAGAAGLLQREAFAPAVVFSSPLQRAVRTTQIVLELLSAPHQPPVDVEEALTERGYGVLTGLRKDRACEEFGVDQTHEWRRSLTSRPPTGAELRATTQEHFHEETLQRGASEPGPPEPGPPELGHVDSELSRRQPLSREEVSGVGPAATAIEISETLLEVVSRVQSWFDETLRPVLALQVPVLVVAHGNSLRALAMLLDDLSEEQVRALNIPTGHPLHYDIADGGVVAGSGRYLDPAAALAAAHAVAHEGGT